MESKALKISKKVVIDFFIIIFIMGFFSKTVIDLFLPKVNMDYVRRGRVVRTIEIPGKLGSKEIEKVRFGENILIEEYYVQTGENIEIGDPIFKVNTDYMSLGTNDRIEGFELQLEKEKQNLERLMNSQIKIEEKRINQLRIKVEKAKTELKEKEILFESGTLTRKQLEEYETQVQALASELEISEMNLEDSYGENKLQIQQSKKNIDKIENDLKIERKKQEFYSNIEEDGIYYSEVNGVLLSINPMNEILMKDRTIVEIGVINGYKDYVFKGKINEQDKETIEEGMEIELFDGILKRSFKAEVTNIYSFVENGRIQIEAELLDEGNGKLAYGKEFTGEIGKSVKSDFVIPKSALVANGPITPGGNAIVYFIHEENGLLGTEYVARAVEIPITHVGDTTISFRGFFLPGVSGKVITNPSYKIKNGVRVGW